MTARDAEGYRAFEATQWSLVGRAGNADSEIRREALDQLLVRYLPALRAHLVLRRRVDPSTADDLLQSFVLEKILERDLVRCADAAKGKFRTFLLTSLENFVASAGRKQSARKRAHEALADDPQNGPERAGTVPCDVFEVAWARQVFAAALQRMRQECSETGRPQVWELFQRRIVAPLVQGTPPVDYSVLLSEFGFASPEQAANALVTAKRHFKRILTSIISEYEEDSVDVEMARLCEVLGQPGALQLTTLGDSCASMVEDRTSPGLPPDSCVGLANVVAEKIDAELWRVEDRGPILRHQLDMPLPMMFAGDPSVLAKVDRWSRQATPAVRTVRDLIGHPAPPIDLLRAVKHSGKRWVTATDRTLPNEVAMVVYLLPIALAVRHGVSITRSSDAHVKSRMLTVATYPWLDADVRGAICGAIALLNRRQ